MPLTFLPNKRHFPLGNFFYCFAQTLNLSSKLNNLYIILYYCIIEMIWCLSFIESQKKKLWTGLTEILHKAGFISPSVF